jgi:nicotinate dehydrogenase subunit A
MTGLAMVTLTVNGRDHSIDADPDTPLLYVLRDDLGLHAAKYGCGLGQCGACTVMIDGAAVFSCVTPVVLLEGKAITTLEGLGTEDQPGPMQRAFIEEQAAQCGYCIAGMMMRAQALLQQNPQADDAEIRRHLEPHLCRCGTHMRILRAVRRAARLMQADVDRPWTDGGVR